MLSGVCSEDQIRPVDVGTSRRLPTAQVVAAAHDSSVPAALVLAAEALGSRQRLYIEEVLELGVEPAG